MKKTNSYVLQGALFPILAQVMVGINIVTSKYLSGLFYVFWFFRCQRVDGVMASLSTAVMPLATVILAWALLGEQLTTGQGIGMGLVILSIVIYARR